MGRDSGWGCLEKIAYRWYFTLEYYNFNYYSRAFDHEVIDGPGAAGRGRETVTFLHFQYHLSIARYRYRSLCGHVAYNLPLD